MPTKNLEQLRDRLYQAFDKAVTRSERIQDYEWANAEKSKAAADALEGAVRASEAVIKVEREIAARALIKELRAEGSDIEVDFEKGTVRTISPMNKIKLKQPET